MADEEEKKKKAEKAQQQKAKYFCKICESMFDEPGMCPNCDVVLKERGE